MRRQVILVMALTSIFALFWACSNDSTNSNLTEGDYTSQDYQLAKEDVDSAMVDMQADNDGVGGWLTWNPGLTLADSVSYDSTSGWHVRIAAFDSETLQVSIVDSFRLADTDGNYQFRRTGLTNSFERRLKRSHIYAINGDTSGTHWIKTYNRNANWVGLADTVTTLNANFSRLWAGQTERRAFSRAVQGNLNDIKFYTADFGTGHRPHPFDGTATANVIVDVQTPNRQAHLEGTLIVIFRLENGQYCYHARLVRGDNWWEWDRCFPE